MRCPQCDRQLIGRPAACTVHGEPADDYYNPATIGDPVLDPTSEEMTEVERRAAEIIGRWARMSETEAMSLAPKAAAYGAADLKIMGESLLVLMPQLRGKVPGEELAIAFYALGKVARLFGAYEQGKVPADDTWYDLGIYARMAQYTREYGQWP